jgi:hypothetical protein
MVKSLSPKVNVPATTCVYGYQIGGADGRVLHHLLHPVRLRRNS